MAEQDKSDVRHRLTGPGLDKFNQTVDEITSGISWDQTSLNRGNIHVDDLRAGLEHAYRAGARAAIISLQQVLDTSDDLPDIELLDVSGRIDDQTSSVGERG